MKYKGIIIEESLTDQELLKSLKTVKKEYYEPLNWHLRTVEATADQIEDLSKTINPAGQWFMHFWNGNDIIVAFHNKLFNLKHDNKKTWQKAIDYGKNIGIPEEQLDFPID